MTEGSADNFLCNPLAATSLPPTHPPRTQPRTHSPFPLAGATITPERRVRVYAACARHGLLIVEDDPYFTLQYPRGPGERMGGGGGKGGGEAAVGARARPAHAHRACPPTPPSSHPLAPTISPPPTHPPTISPPPTHTHPLLPPDDVPGLHGLAAGACGAPPSYLSMDCDGRVVRVDSFAKFLAPGGWVAGAWVGGRWEGAWVGRAGERVRGRVGEHDCCKYPPPPPTQTHTRAQA